MPNDKVKTIIKPYEIYPILSVKAITNDETSNKSHIKG